MTEHLQTESSYLGVRFGVDNNFFPPSRSGEGRADGPSTRPAEFSWPIQPEQRAKPR
jgi:hypothetical protein